jgi:hypothetical protein
LSVQSSPPQSPAIGAMALVVLACLPYALMLAAFLTMPVGDPGAFGAEGTLAASLSQLYALVSGVLLWALLGILLWIGWKSGGMPRWVGIGTGLLYPLSAVAAVVAAGLSYSYPGGWLMLVPEALPPALALFAMWASLPALRAVLRPDITGGALLGLIAVVIIATAPLWYLDDLQFPARLARQQAEGEAIVAQREAEWEKHREERVAQFQGLTPASSLLDYLDAPTEIDREQAVAGARQVKSRQSEAIMLIKEGKLRRLEELWRFDLEASPALCEAFDMALRKQVIDDDLNWTVAARLEEQLPNAKWLVAEHCNLDGSVTAAETRMRGIIAVSQKDDLPRGQRILDALGELHQKR